MRLVCCSFSVTSHLCLALTPATPRHPRSLAPMHLQQSFAGDARRALEQSPWAVRRPKRALQSTASRSRTLTERGEFAPPSKTWLSAISKKPAKAERCFPSPCNFQSHFLPSWMTTATCRSLTSPKPTSCLPACSTTSPSAPPPWCLASSSFFSFCSLPLSQCHTPSLSPFLWLCASATWSPRRPP